MTLSPPQQQQVLGAERGWGSRGPEWCGGWVNGAHKGRQSLTRWRQEVTKLSSPTAPCTPTASYLLWPDKIQWPLCGPLLPAPVGHSLLEAFAFSGCCGPAFCCSWGSCPQLRPVLHTTPSASPQPSLRSTCRGHPHPHLHPDLCPEPGHRPPKTPL